MSNDVTIREGALGDRAGILRLYPEVFPKENLLPLVEALLDLRSGVLSLVAVVGGEIVGHVLFTEGGIRGSRETAALLGPLAVAPVRQGRGLGTALVEAGLERLRAQGTGRVFVLGDPGYYGRFGFVAEDRVETPFPLSEEWSGAWQSIRFPGEGTSRPGTISLPAPWLQRRWWTA